MSKRSLSNAFEKLEPKQEEQQPEVKVEVITEEEYNQGNNSQVEEAVEVAPVEEAELETNELEEEVSFLDLFDEKTNQKTMEETHRRATFLIDEQILKQLDKMAKKKKRGFKTHFVNYAIQKALKELE